MEAFLRISVNQATAALDLSELDLWAKGTGGKSPLPGGWYPSGAMEFLQKTGVVGESLCPYSAISNVPTLPENARRTMISGWSLARGRDELKLALLNGPVLASMRVWADFFYYKSGIYQPKTGPEIGDHAILLVGYDDDQGCWIAQNSWSAFWGENGFFRIGFGQINNVGISFSKLKENRAPIATGTDIGIGTATGTDLATGTGGYHPHESPWTMLVPLGLLGLGAIFSGFLFHIPFVEAEEGLAFWNGSIALDTQLLHALHEVPLWVKLAPGIVMLTGLAIAWLAYIRYTDWPEKFAGQFRVLYAFLLNKWYFDEIYNAVLVRPSFAIGRFLWKRVDKGFIDRFGPDGVSALVVGGTGLTRRFQSGYLAAYAFVMLIGLAAAATWAMTR